MREKFNLGEMATAIGRHDYEIKIILGLPLGATCNLEGIDDALAKYHSPIQGEERLALQKKLDGLLLAELDSIDSKEELKIFRKKCPHGFLAREATILKEIELCESLEEINVFKNLSSMYSGAGWRMNYLKRKLKLSESLDDLKSLLAECPPKSDIYYSVNYKWNIVSEKVIRRVHEPQKMEEIFDNLCPESYPFLLECWLGICDKSAEFQKMYRFLFESNGRIALCHNAFIANLCSKWDYASFAEASEARNFSESLIVLNHSQADSKRQTEIFEQCLNFVKTADDAEELFIYAPKVKGILEKSFNKWLEISDCQEAIRMLGFFKETPGESKEIFSFLDRREVASAIIKKIASFYGYKE